MEFYDYLLRHEDYSIQLSKNLKKQMFGSMRGFKGFLYHINKSKQFDAKLLKLSVPRQRPKVVKQEIFIALLKACTNTRDVFLLHLLSGSGMRIGEALSLWLEDFEIDAKKIHICDRGELPNYAEIKTVTSPRTIDVSAELVNLFMDYVAEVHVDEVDTNFVFIKLSGEKKYEPMEYSCVSSLFKRLEKKTGIKTNPHMFRHTHFNDLRKQGWAPEMVQKRGGWSNVQTPMQVYYHPDDEEMTDAWKKAEERMKANKHNNKGDAK
jgi:integrase/recombinase XerD